MDIPQHRTQGWDWSPLRFIGVVIPILLVIMLAAFSTCVPKGAVQVDTVKVEPVLGPVSAPVTVEVPEGAVQAPIKIEVARPDIKVNIGTGWWFAPPAFLLLVIAFVLWRRGRKARKAVDMLVESIEDTDLQPYWKGLSFKEEIRTRALSRKLETYLRQRIGKVRKKRNKHAPR